MTVVVFIIVLAILIFVHELGHFLLARRSGVRVDEFALGFGPTLFKKKKGETLYKLNLIPFGGYVKIFGENPDEESLIGKDSSRSFIHASKWHQASILFAGVLFNFIFAWILIAISFGSGVIVSTDSHLNYLDRMSDHRITITFIEPGSPAEKAGIAVGDTLVGFSSTDAVKAYIANSNGKSINLKYIRGGEEKVASIVPIEGLVSDKYAIGIAMDKTAILQLPIHLAVYEGGKFTLTMMWGTIKGFASLVFGIFTGKAFLSSVTGPVGIAGMVGDAAKLGFTYLLMFTAVISVNLGIINLVPFPALDGGRILFVIIEAIMGRPIKPIIANTVNTIGFGLLMLLIVVITYRDIAKLVH